MAFEVFVLPGDDEPKMAIHLFIAILSEYLTANITAAQARTAIEDHLGVTLLTNQIQDITDTIAYVDGGSNITQKTLRMMEVYRVLVLAEHGSIYPTQADVRTRLSWGTPD